MIAKLILRNPCKFIKNSKYFCSEKKFNAAVILAGWGAKDGS